MFIKCKHVIEEINHLTHVQSYHITIHQIARKLNAEAKGKGREKPDI